MAHAARRMMRAPSILVACLALAGCAVGTARPAPERATAEQLFRGLFEQALTRGDSAMIGRLVAPRVVFHAGGRTAHMTPASLWLISRPIRTAFPDIRFYVDQVVENGSTAAARIRFTGTHRGPYAGVEPTGRAVEVTEMFFCRVENGLLAECWQEWDEYGLRRQLGAP